jgi:acyl carrier protein
VLDHSQVPDLREIAEVFANEEGSLSLLRIVADIEAEFGIHIPDEAFHTLRTLRTLRALLAHVEKPAAAA